jgi:pimeloyl-ACP methyl ester carboxylesterase
MAGMTPGAGVIVLPVGPDNAPMWVWYYRPAGLRANDRVLFVMHGVLRNADLYRDDCIRLAQEYRVLLVVPEFSRALFPTNPSYNYGNLEDEAGAALPPSHSSFAVIDRIFDQIRPLTPVERDSFTIFGHSAGAQFVHRYLTLYAPKRVEAAVSANAGSYILPLPSEEYPFGVKDRAVSEADLKALFARRHHIFLGEADNDPNDDHLPKEPSAMRQGAHRLERGRRYFEIAEAEALRLGTPFNWQLTTVPNVGHEGGLMAAAAAPHLFSSPVD